MLEDKRGRIWFGAWEKNLVRYEGGNFYPEAFPLVTALFEDREFRLWVGNHRAWYRNGSNWIPAEPHWAPITNLTNGEVDVISQDREGNIWYGGVETGISRFDGNKVRKFTTADGLPGVSVTSFLQTRGGTIWVGTTTGLARLEGDRFVSFTTEGNYIRSLYEDSEGTIWIGTYDSGITRFKDGKFSSITKSKGYSVTEFFAFLRMTMDGSG